MQVELQAELDTFASWERMSTDFSQLLRAAFKEFHHGCRYYKGQGRAFGVWLRETHPRAFAIHLERADGGRQVCVDGGMEALRVVSFAPTSMPSSEPSHGLRIWIMMLLFRYTLTASSS